VPGANASGICVSGVLALHIVFTELDDVRIRFEAACFRIGEGSARQAFSLALNKEGRKAFTAHRRALAEQSSIPRGAVTAAMKFKASTRVALAPQPGFRVFFPVSLFHFVLEMIGGSPGISPPEGRPPRCPKKEKPTSVGRLPSSVRFARTMLP